MKKIIPIKIILVFFLSSPLGPLHAQFFKEIGNTIKQTAQSRADSKASQTTNKVIDQADSGTRGRPSTAGKNSSGNNNSNSNNPLPAPDKDPDNSVLGAFAKAAQANPNDTSSADLSMKALGILAGGTGVSKEDSVKAINSFKTAEGGTGIHYLYTMTTANTKKQSNVTDSSQLYFTANGEGRMEMRIPVPGVKLYQLITIARSNENMYSLSLYPDSKTYSLNVLDSTILSRAEDNYQVVKLGTERVGGYSCSHLKLISTKRNGQSSTEIWTSTEVPGYSTYKKLFHLRASDAGVMSALSKAGCDGVMVKMKISGTDASLEELLIKANQERLSPDLFRIPAGYTESDGNMISHMFPSTGK